MISVMAIVDAVRRGAVSVRWYVREFFGDSAYERYLVHHAATHPDHPALSEREFWRMRDRDAESQVISGCC